MKRAVYWDVAPFLRTDVSDERVASIFRVEGIREGRVALALG
jgi:hypothetical protein